VALELTNDVGIVLLIARVLIGGTLAFMGLNHFMDVDGMAGYAASKGIPAPSLAVVFSGGQLAVGGLAVVFGIYPALGAGALVLFFVVATPTMHDFWTVDDPEQQQQEMTHFLKNVALLGVSLTLLVLAGAEWPYAVNLTL
jgi:uncharacterized membrane protein YphA (DoxX/SURF4 family)